MFEFKDSQQHKHYIFPDVQQVLRNPDGNIRHQTNAIRAQNKEISEWLQMGLPGLEWRSFGCRIRFRISCIGFRVDDMLPLKGTFIMFGMGTTLSPKDFARVVRFPWPVCVGVFLQFPERDIPTGTKFETLPADWTCPACDGEKSRFFKPQP